MPLRPDDRPATRTRAWPLTSLGLAIAFGLPEAHVARWFGHTTAFDPLNEATWWGIALMLLGYVRFVERRPVSSIGLRRPTVRTWLVGFATALLLFASVVAIYAIVFPMLGLSMNRAATANITHRSIPFQVLLAFRAAVVEEILYRGYPITRIAELTGSRTIAVVVSVVVFTVAHIGYWGGAQLLIVLPAAIVLALLFLWRRDLVCNMFAHFLVDTAGFLAATLQS